MSAAVRDALKPAIGYSMVVSIPGHPEIREAYRTVEDADGLLDRLTPIVERLVEQARLEGEGKTVILRDFPTVGKCEDGCGRTMVRRKLWRTLTPYERIGHGMYEAGGKCRACYSKLQRRGIKVPTSRYLIADLLNDIEDLLEQEATITRNGLAVRLGLSLPTLESALYRARAKGKGDHPERADKIITEVRR